MKIAKRVYYAGKRLSGEETHLGKEKLLGEKKTPLDEKSVSVRQYLDNHDSIPIGSLSFYDLINTTIAAMFDKTKKIQRNLDFLLSVHE